MTMRETKNLTCISCPLGCQLEVVVEDGKIVQIANYSCIRGKEYAEKEVLSPKRTITSILPVAGGDVPMVSVKTSEPIPKAKIGDCMRLLKDLKIVAPIEIGDVILANICDTGSDIVATKRVKRL